MISDEKIKQLQKKVRSGYPEGEIRAELAREGHSEEDIAKVFTPHHYEMRSWYLISAFIVLFIGIWSYLSRGSVFELILSGLLFWQYYRERGRLTKNNVTTRNTSPSKDN